MAAAAFDSPPSLVCYLEGGKTKTEVRHQVLKSLRGSSHLGRCRHLWFTLVRAPSLLSCLLPAPCPARQAQ